VHDTDTIPPMVWVNDPVITPAFGLG